MLSKEGILKLIDFGMAKKFGEAVAHTKGIITQCYRPPELLFGSEFYGPSADIWSAGCILAEIIIRKPLFPGQPNNVLDQLQRIFAIRGTPDTDPDWKNVKCLENYISFSTTTE